MVVRGRLQFTPSILVEILGVNIQCCSFSKRKMGRSENVLVSIGKFKRKRKNALIKSIAYNFWNVSYGMVCTISFSNQSFRVFRVNGKRPGTPSFPALNPGGKNERRMRTVMVNHRSGVCVFPVPCFIGRKTWKFSLKQVLKPQRLLSPRKFNSRSLNSKVWLLLINNRREQSWYTLRVSAEKCFTRAGDTIFIQQTIYCFHIIFSSQISLDHYS